jgi:hypothetical protein
MLHKSAKISATVDESGQILIELRQKNRENAKENIDRARIDTGHVLIHTSQSIMATVTCIIAKVARIGRRTIKPTLTGGSRRSRVNKPECISSSMALLFLFTH